ncbi:MAG: hypothetical protein HPM95_08710 [Alphaproteobacteria bacterium]|nr:hypothetical protein [Alphaproteobacteria bacterium]
MKEGVDAFIAQAKLDAPYGMTVVVMARLQQDGQAIGARPDLPAYPTRSLSGSKHPEEDIIFGQICLRGRDQHSRHDNFWRPILSGDAVSSREPAACMYSGRIIIPEPVVLLPRQRAGAN